MAFREQEYLERCAVCGKVADERCPRCGQNTCAGHRAPDLLCQPCERAYAEHLAREEAALLARVAERGRKWRGRSVFVPILLFVLLAALAHHFQIVSTGFDYNWLASGGVTIAFVFPWFRFVAWWDKRLEARSDAEERERLRARFIASSR